MAGGGRGGSGPVTVGQGGGGGDVGGPRMGPAGRAPAMAGWRQRARTGGDVGVGVGVLVRSK
jgi:hypothetical protein